MMSNMQLSTVVEALYQELKCSVCLSMLSEPHSLPCLHIFCKSCVDRCLTIRPNCPLCNANFHRRQVDPSGVISAVIVIYKKLYKALSAVAAVPCLSQALDVSPACNNNLLKMTKSHSTTHRTPSPNQKPSAAPGEPSSTLRQVSIEPFFGKQQQAAANNGTSPASVHDEAQITTSPSVEFRTLTTPVRTKPPNAFRSQIEEAYIEPWSPYESSTLSLNLPRCSICFDADASRPLQSCSKCGVAVHYGCYGIPPDVSDNREWTCVPCSSGEKSSPSCVLCPNTDDRAFRACSRELNSWVHVSCALWAPQPRFSDTSFGNGGHVEDVGKVPIASKKLRCIICRKRGFCLQCEYGRCTTAFHVPCAARSGVKLELRELNEKIYFHQFCPSHAHLSKEVPTDNTAGSAFARRTERRISLSPSPAPKRRNPLSTGRSRSRHQGRFVLLLTGLKLTDSMSKLLSTSKDVDVTMNLSECVTHVITKCYTTGAQCGKAKARTVKYMFGVARGAWCVSQLWIQDWIKFGNAPDELRYEVLGDYAAIGAPRRSRVSRSQGKSPLFNGVDFIITGPFSKHLGLHIELAEIIKAAGGSVSSSIPDKRPSRPTVLINEPVGQDEDESEQRENASIRQQCLSIGIPVYDVQWLFGLLSYYTSPIISS